jgi:methyl-accepting chemotaxis protein
MKKAESIQKKNKISFWYSIKWKVMFLAILAVILTGVIGLLNSVFQMQKNVEDTTKNYMKDIAILVGKQIDAKDMQQLEADELKQTAEQVGIEGAKSSYAYIVSSDGTMLYHPTGKKIGKPVENAAVKQIVQEINKGNFPKPNVIKYQFQGVDKYAAYYIGANHNFIVIITADRAEIFQNLHHMIKTNILFYALLLIILCIISFVISGVIVKPIHQISEVIFDLAGMDFSTHGTLDKLSIEKSEIGEMAKAVAILQKQMYQIISEIKQKSGSLYETSQQISERSQKTATKVGQVQEVVSQIAESVNCQAEETQNATENVLNMGSMIGQTKDEMQHLEKNAIGMQKSGKQARDILEKLNVINERTKNAIQEISMQTVQTNTSATEIEGAIGIITDIADETNLLALNASIEAARAGEQGKGFAVVASQIQKLAEQSNASAEQISKIIKSLLKNSEKMVEIMQDVNAVVEEQYKDVEDTATSFTVVEQGIISSMTSIQKIVAKVENLDNLRGDVVSSVKNLESIAQRNAGSTEKSSSSIVEINENISNISEQNQKLHEIVEKLNENIEEFKII